jgi:hypothetical protein
MIGVKDSGGNAIEGLFRDEANQGLTVKAPDKYAKYLKEKERAEDVVRLKQDVSEMKDMLNQILKAING